MTKDEYDKLSEAEKEKLKKDAEAYGQTLMDEFHTLFILYIAGRKLPAEIALSLIQVEERSLRKAIEKNGPDGGRLTFDFREILAELGLNVVAMSELNGMVDQYRKATAGKTAGKAPAPPGDPSNN